MFTSLLAAGTESPIWAQLASTESSLALCEHITHSLCLQALARACVAIAVEQPAETKQVTTRLVEQLLFLVNPENELAHLDVPGPVSYLQSICCVNVVSHVRWYTMHVGGPASYLQSICCMTVISRVKWYSLHLCALPQLTAQAYVVRVLWELCVTALLYHSSDTLYPSSLLCSLLF